MEAFSAQVAARAEALRADGIELTPAEYLRGLILRDLDASVVAVAPSVAPAPAEPTAAPPRARKGAR